MLQPIDSYYDTTSDPVVDTPDLSLLPLSRSTLQTPVGPAVALELTPDPWMVCKRVQLRGQTCSKLCRAWYPGSKRIQTDNDTKTSRLRDLFTPSEVVPCNSPVCPDLSSSPLDGLDLSSPTKLVTVPTKCLHSLKEDDPRRWQQDKLRLAFFDFRKHLRKVKSRVTVIHNNLTGQDMEVSATSHSRYFQDGRSRIYKNIKDRLGRWFYSSGVMLTLTYDPKRIPKEFAWRDCNDHWHTLIRTINQYRKRHYLAANGSGRNLKYIWVVEEIPAQHYDPQLKRMVKNAAAGYPHIHVFFPGLDYLAKYEKINEWWHYGYNQVEKMGNLDVTGYICKYVAKLKGWSKYGLTAIWIYKKRIYGYSRSYVLPRMSPDTRSPWYYQGTLTWSGLEWSKRSDTPQTFYEEYSDWVKWRRSDPDLEAVLARHFTDPDGVPDRVLLGMEVNSWN